MSSDIQARKLLVFGDKKFFGGQVAAPAHDSDRRVPERDLTFLRLIAARIRYLEQRGERP